MHQIKIRISTCSKKTSVKFVSYVSVEKIYMENDPIQPNNRMIDKNIDVKLRTQRIPNEALKGRARIALKQNLVYKKDHKNNLYLSF